MQTHARLQILNGKPLGLGPPFPYSPDDVIRSGLNETPIPENDPPYRFLAVGFDSLDPGCSVSVVNRLANSAAFHEFADWNHSSWRGNQCFVGLAGGQLRTLLDAGVEPDGTVEGGFLMHQQMRQLIPEDFRGLGRREV
ncbi:MAG TPA: hypothetical protein VG104_06660, partial [Candidatus Dormibacteraeota bacterium]|nr:hypothetical protein [Candidatus Dormibacteraeota bacterium]